MHRHFNPRNGPSQKNSSLLMRVLSENFSHSSLEGPPIFFAVKSQLIYGSDSIGILKQGMSKGSLPLLDSTSWPWNSMEVSHSVRSQGQPCFTFNIWWGWLTWATQVMSHACARCAVINSMCNNLACFWIISNALHVDVSLEVEGVMTWTKK